MGTSYLSPTIHTQLSRLCLQLTRTVNLWHCWPGLIRSWQEPQRLCTHKLCIQTPTACASKELGIAHLLGGGVSITAAAHPRDLVATGTPPCPHPSPRARPPAFCRRKVSAFLLSRNYLLTALELLLESSEAGREGDAAQLGAFFSDRSRFPPEELANFEPENGECTCCCVIVLQGTNGLPLAPAHTWAATLLHTRSLHTHARTHARARMHARTRSHQPAARGKGPRAAPVRSRV